MSAAKTPLRALQTNKNGQENKFWALRDVTFDVLPGDVIGIVGGNGAGKSTLLKILSRITEPTDGRITLHGRVGSLLEVGTGFHHELTGRENIYLNGAILGMQRKEISKKFDEIVNFAEVENFLDTPVKHYSSGMYVRLAFAVAANLETEILIVDEVLAVGDAQFQKKCLGKMSEVSKHGRTVLFVSHNMGTISQLCTKGIYLSSGELEYVGEIDRTVDYYLSNAVAESAAFVKDESLDTNSSDSKELEFRKISLHSDNLKESYVFEVNESIFIKFEINIKRIPPNASLFLMVLNRDKTPVCAFESDAIEEEMTLKIEPDFLVRGKYSIHAFLHVPMKTQIDIVHDRLSFEVNDFSSKFVQHGTYNYGSIVGKGEWI
ncbi:MAG TPA: polysaccharide ABC transporter ATP-binding protein [Pyrinomonadaceae bacterium]|nr:polysaccharide ABC transporter ATP-binding protein [Pyrinomonadaceae bacterium]